MLRVTRFWRVSRRGGHCAGTRFPRVSTDIPALPKGARGKGVLLKEALSKRALPKEALSKRALWKGALRKGALVSPGAPLVLRALLLASLGLLFADFAYAGKSEDSKASTAASTAASIRKSHVGQIGGQQTEERKDQPQEAQRRRATHREHKRKSHQKACRSPEKALGVARTIEIDTESARGHGSVNYGETGLLRDKEVVLTFDDGPYRGRTERILDALDAHCTKATFFSVGSMAMAWPETLREVARRGHTIAAHSWNHPNFARLSLARGTSNIEKGMAALSAVIGRPIAPFFRFPYLHETRALKAYLAKRKVTIFSIDIESGDTRGYSAARMVRAVMRQLAERGKGIILFHDIKKTTVSAIPRLLKQLKAKGYKVVHIVPKQSFEPLPALARSFHQRLAKREARRRRHAGLRQAPPVPESRRHMLVRLAEHLERADRSRRPGPLGERRFAWLAEAERVLLADAEGAKAGQRTVAESSAQAPAQAVAKPGAGGPGAQSAPTAGVRPGRAKRKGRRRARARSARKSWYRGQAALALARSNRSSRSRDAFWSER